MAPQRIVILRHGEKPGDPGAPDVPASPNLSPDGVARARMLETLIPAKFGEPDFLFAAASSNNSHRPVETVEPLAIKLGLGSNRFIQTIENKDYGWLAQNLLAKPTYSEKLIVVCWHHGNIPALGQALGLKQSDYAFLPEMNGHANPQGNGNKWNAAEFNKFWILDYAAAGGVRFQSVDQQPR